MAHVHCIYLILQYYLTISEAIEDSDEGDRIVVHPGVYNEAIVVNKPLSLIGAGPERVLLVSLSHTVVEIGKLLTNVSLSNMEIKVSILSFSGREGNQ